MADTQVTHVNQQSQVVYTVVHPETLFRLTTAGLAKMLQKTSKRL